MHSTENKNKKNKSGFTLIELLVVISIIGLMSSIVLAGLNVARAKARDARRMADLKQLENALNLYYLTNGKYPPIFSGPGSSACSAITNDPSVNAFKTALSPYISTVPNDPLFNGTSVMNNANLPYAYQYCYSSLSLPSPLSDPNAYQYYAIWAKLETQSGNYGGSTWASPYNLSNYNFVLSNWRP